MLWRTFEPDNPTFSINQARFPVNPATFLVNQTGPQINRFGYKGKLRQHLGEPVHLFSKLSHLFYQTTSPFCRSGLLNR